MKITVCDQCQKEGKLTKARFRASYRTRVEKISLDACEQHSEPFKDCKGMEDARKVAANVLYGGE